LSEHGQHPDFKKLTKRLTAYGSVVFAEFSLGRKDAVIPGTGLSVGDFVGKVLLEYTLGKIKHHKSRGSLITVLGTAMRNDIIDALRQEVARARRDALLDLGQRGLGTASPRKTGPRCLSPAVCARSGFNTRRG
jgi:hypothetical protein